MIDRVLSERLGVSVTIVSGVTSVKAVLAPTRFAFSPSTVDIPRSGVPTSGGRLSRSRIRPSGQPPCRHHGPVTHGRASSARPVAVGPGSHTGRQGRDRLLRRRGGSRVPIVDGRHEGPPAAMDSVATRCLHRPPHRSSPDISSGQCRHSVDHSQRNDPPADPRPTGGDSAITHGNRTFPCLFNQSAAPFHKPAITWDTEATDCSSVGPDSPEYGPRGCPRGASFSRYTYSPTCIATPTSPSSRLGWWRAGVALSDLGTNLVGEVGARMIEHQMELEQVVRLRRLAPSIQRYCIRPNRRVLDQHQPTLT